MSTYIGNDLEDRLEALEVENASLRKYNEYHQVVNEIDHMSELHIDSSFYKQSMKIDNYFKMNKWIDSSIGQSTVLQELNKRDPHYPIQTKRKIGEGTLTLKMAHISFVASVTNLLLNGIIGNSIKYIAFYKTHSGLGLLISTAYEGSYVAVPNDDSSFIGLNYKFPSSKSNCTIFNKCHVISVTWSNIKDLSNCWSMVKR